MASSGPWGQSQQRWEAWRKGGGCPGFTSTWGASASAPSSSAASCWASERVLPVRELLEASWSGKENKGQPGRCHEQHTGSGDCREGGSRRCVAGPGPFAAVPGRTASLLSAAQRMQVTAVTRHGGARLRAPSKAVLGQAAPWPWL